MGVLKVLVLGLFIVGLAVSEDENKEVTDRNVMKAVVKTVELRDFTRERCNEILVSKGFYKKKSNDDQVPPEYENGPYVGHGEL